MTSRATPAGAVGRRGSLHWTERVPRRLCGRPGVSRGGLGPVQGCQEARREDLRRPDTSRGDSTSQRVSSESCPILSDARPLDSRSTKVVISADTFSLPADHKPTSTPARGASAAGPAGRGGPPASSAADSLFGGSKEALQSLRELVVWPIVHGAMAAQLGVRFPKGVLLHGPPGVRLLCFVSLWSMFR